MSYTITVEDDTTEQTVFLLRVKALDLADLASSVLYNAKRAEEGALKNASLQAVPAEN